MKCYFDRSDFLFFSLIDHGYQKHKFEANFFFVLICYWSFKIFFFFSSNFLQVGPPERLCVFHVTNISRLLNLMHLNVFFVCGIFFSQRHAFKMLKLWIHCKIFFVVLFAQENTFELTAG